MREIIFKFELFLLTFRLSAELHGEAVVVGVPLSEPDDVKIKLEKNCSSCVCCSEMFEPPSM